MRRALAHLLVLVVGLVVGVLVSGCSGDDTASTASTAPLLGEPTPPLPADILPDAFPPGQRAALGNLKVTLRVLTATADETDIELGLENGALVPATFDPDTFRLYFTDGSSMLADEASGPSLSGPVASGTATTLQLTFRHPDGRTPLMVLVDGSADDRINSAGFLLAGSDPDQSATSTTTDE